MVGFHLAVLAPVAILVAVSGFAQEKHPNSNAFVREPIVQPAKPATVPAAQAATILAPRSLTFLFSGKPARPLRTGIETEVFDFDDMITPCTAFPGNPVFKIAGGVVTIIKGEFK